MQKTYAEIIDETLAAGYTLTNRATDSGGYCHYIESRTGLMCAVGRCCEAPQDSWRGGWTTLTVSGKQLEVAEREELLKPEYRGKSVFFWMDLQNLHDCHSNWAETGLSSAGKLEVSKIKHKWCNLDSTN